MVLIQLYSHFGRCSLWFVVCAVQLYCFILRGVSNNLSALIDVNGVDKIIQPLMRDHK